MTTVTPNGAGPLKPVHGTPVQGAAMADEAEVKSGKVALSENDLALGGYDCMSYHVPGAKSPALGVPEHEVTTYNVVQGQVRYRFASQENAEAFKKSHFLEVTPQYGGFCAEGVTKNMLLHANPLAWSIGGEDHKLFLFCCDIAKNTWEKDFEKNRASADAAWPALARGEPGTEAPACCSECKCCNSAAAGA
jgi:hypothetical protein